MKRISSLVTLEDAIQARKGASGSLVVNSKLSVPADLTVPSTMRLEFADGGSLDVARGATLTIDTPVSGWPMRQVFDGDGDVCFGLRSAVTAVYPQWWGAKGDEVSDDSQAINQALRSALRSARQCTIFLPAGIYRANVVLPDPLPGSSSYSVRLRGAGMDSTYFRRASEKSPAIAAAATPPDAPNRTIFLEDMTVVGVAPGGGQATTTAPVISLDAPRYSSIAPRIMGAIRNVRVSGAAGTKSIPAGETLIDVIGAMNFAMADIEANGGRQALHLKDSSFSYVTNFHANYNIINGIWIDGGGLHTFINARVEDGRVEDPIDDAFGQRMTTALRLTNASHNQFIGFSNEGKTGIHAAVLIEGTGEGERVSSLNVSHGGSVGGPSPSPNGGTRHTILLRGQVEHTRIHDVRIAKNLDPGHFTFGLKAFRGGLPTLNSVSGVLYGDAHGDRPLIDQDSGARGNHLRLVDNATSVQAPLELGTTVAVSGAYAISPSESGQTFHSGGATRPPVLSLPPSKIRGTFLGGCAFRFMAGDQPMSIAPAPGESIRGSGAGQLLALPAGKSLALRLLAPGTWDVVDREGGSPAPVPVPKTPRRFDGRVTIPRGQTSVTVEHNLGGQPAPEDVTATLDGPTRVWCAGIDGKTLRFRIERQAPVGGVTFMASATLR